MSWKLLGKEIPNRVARDACLENAEQAARDEAEARRQLARFEAMEPIDDADKKRLRAARDHWREAVNRGVAEQPHWRQLAGWYEEQMAEEPTPPPEINFTPAPPPANEEDVPAWDR